MPTPGLQARPIPARAVILGRGRRIDEVAAAVGVNAHTFGRVLNGYTDAWPALRERVAAELGLPESELFDETSLLGRLIRGSTS